MSTNRPRNARDLIVLAVTTLPTGSDRYEGREILLHPYGNLSGGPIWHCVWKSALQSGAGAWAVLGGFPLRAWDSEAASVATATPGYTWASLSTGPALTIPIRGLYVVHYHLTGWIQSAAARNDERAGLMVNSSQLHTVGSGAHVNAQYDWATWSGSTGNIYREFIANDVIRISRASASGTSTTWSYYDMSIEAKPLEVY